MRGRVTQIAARLFRDEGIAALSMRRIAREAGMPVMSLYDYFRSKNEIIRGIWDRFFSKCFDRVDRAISGCDGEEAGRRLEVACMAYVRYWLDHPDEYRAVFMIEDTVEGQERYYVETSTILERYRVFARLLAEHLGGTGEFGGSDASDGSDRPDGSGWSGWSGGSGGSGGTGRAAGSDVSSERLRDRTVALICALTGICHMLVTVSEHSWPAPDRLVRQALRMVDGPLDE